MVAEVARDRRAAAVGSRRSPKSTTIAIVPTRSGTPTSANSKKPKPPDARVVGGVGDDDVDGRCRSARAASPRGRRTRAACRSCDGERPSRTASTTTTGSERGDRAVDVISAVRSATSSSMQHEQPRPAVAGRGDQLLPGPGRDARGVEPLADDEQRGDEEHGRVAEARERLLEPSTPVAQSVSATPIATIATGMRSQTKHADRRAEDEEGDRGVAHASRLHARAPTRASRLADRRLSRLSARVHRGARAERDPEQVPADEEQRPDDAEDEDERQHHRRRPCRCRRPSGSAARR